MRSINKETIQTPQNIFARTFLCNVPTSVWEALTNPKWTQAIKEEMEALLKNETLALVLLHEGKRMGEYK